MPRPSPAPADHLGVLASTRGFTARDEVHGLEDVRLPGAVRAYECGNARVEVDPSLFVTAEILEPDRGDAQGRRLRSGRDSERHHHMKIAVVADDLDDTGGEGAAELERDLRSREARKRVG